MTRRKARPPIDQIDEAGQEVSTSASAAKATVHRRYDPRAFRARRRAARALDELLGLELPPLEPIDRGDFWGEAHAHLDLGQRDDAGRQLSLVGWCP